MTWQNLSFFFWGGGGYFMKQLGNHAKKSSFAMVYCQYFSVLASEKVKYFQHPNQLMGSQGVSEVKKKKKKIRPPIQETWVCSLCQEDPLEKEMATHPSILAWEIQWTE